MLAALPDKPMLAQAVPIDPDSLSSLAMAYTNSMTSIRGRRVQRLLKREFAGAACVLLALSDSGTPLVMGLSSSGAAICCTDGTGKQASVIKWRHKEDEAIETQFDLHKDSLPVLGQRSLSLAQLRDQIHVHVPAEGIPAHAGAWVAEVLRALA